MKRALAVGLVTVIGCGVLGTHAAWWIDALSQGGLLVYLLATLHVTVATAFFTSLAASFLLPSEAAVVSAAATPTFTNEEVVGMK
jgi:hypothetical protein